MRKQSLLAFEESGVQHPAPLRVVLDDIQVQGFDKGLRQAEFIALFIKLKIEASKRGVHAKVGMTAVLGMIVVAYMRDKKTRLAATSNADLF